MDFADAYENFLASASHLKLENCVKQWYFARKYKCLVLMHATSTFIAKHAAEMSKQADFLRMPFSDFADLVLIKPVEAFSGVQRYRAAIIWLEHDNIGRASHTHDIMSLILSKSTSLPLDIIFEANQSEMLKQHVPKLLKKTLNYAVKKQKEIPSVLSSVSDDHSAPCKNWYLVGGVSGEPGKTENRWNSFMKYDTDARSWSQLPPLPFKRSSTRTCSVGSRLIVMGGMKEHYVCDGSGSWLSNEINEYDLPTKKWTTSAAKLLLARKGFGLCSDGRKYAYVLGGDNCDEKWDAEVQRFCPETTEVVKQKPMYEKRTFHAAVYCTAANSNCIFVVGGYNRAMWTQDIVYSMQSIDKYDVSSGASSKVGQLTKGRYWVTAVMSNDDLYIAGGNSETDGALNSVEIFNVVTGKTRTAAPLLKPRLNHAAATLFNGNVVCMVGGNDDKTRLLDSVEAYDVREGKWSISVIVPSMPEPKSYFGFAAV